MGKKPKAIKPFASSRLRSSRRSKFPRGQRDDPWPRALSQALVAAAVAESQGVTACEGDEEDKDAVDDDAGR